jgi:ribosomal protein S18 acetylase RimI-like enzyme
VGVFLQQPNPEPRNLREIPQFGRNMLFSPPMAVMSNSHLTLDQPENTVCRPANPNEVQLAIAMVLGSPTKPAPASQVADFINAAPQRRIDVRAVWIVQNSGRTLWSILPVINPGRTCLLLAPGDLPDSTFPAAAHLINQICRGLADGGLHLSQVLLEPHHIRTRRLFTSTGFNEIAELIYLQGFIPKSLQPAPITNQMRWLSYSRQTHDSFAQTIIRTYEDSLDCPALSGLRHIDDILAGHQATGEFDPNAWQLLVENDHPLGVVLLSRIPHTDVMELVYLGLAPEARTRGLGTILMRHAMHVTIHDQRRKISLAVDSKNDPALKLYYRSGLQQVATRHALIRDLRPPVA